jgi:hypothetical protein
VSEIKLVFGIPPDRPTLNFPPSWNVAPTDSSLPVVRYDGKSGHRSLDMLRWGVTRSSASSPGGDARANDRLALAEFLTDSLLEGTGVERSVPREAPCRATYRERVGERGCPISPLRTDSLPLVSKIDWPENADDAIMDAPEWLEPIGFVKFAPALREDPGGCESADHPKIARTAEGGVRSNPCLVPAWPA